MILQNVEVPSREFGELVSRLRTPIPTPPLDQEAYDLDEREFWKFVEQGSIPVGVFQNYCTDLCYVDRIDAGVFRYLLPRAIELWQLSLSGDCDANHAVAEFHAALFRRPTIVRDLLGEREEFAFTKCIVDILSSCVRGATLEEPRLGWVPGWVGLGAGLDSIVESWWGKLEANESPGAAATYMAYISRIVYPPGRPPGSNPILGVTYDGPEPWSRTQFITPGIYWREPVVSLFRECITVERVVKALRVANAQLRIGYGDVIDLLIHDFEKHMNPFERRKAEALRNLTSPDPPDYWSDGFVP